MAGATKIRAARADDGIVTVKVLANHPMENGLRRDRKTGETIPAHYITELVVKCKDKVVATFQSGPNVSTNPYLAVKFKDGAVGDPVTVSWVDTKGESDSVTGNIT